MPQAIPFIAAAAAAAGATTILGPALAATFLGSLVIFGSAAAASLIAGRLIGDLGARKQPFIGEVNSRRTMVQSSAEPRRMAWGRTRFSGVLAYASVTDREGNDNAFLHCVVAFAHTVIDAFNDVYIGDDVITPAMLDGSGDVTSGRYYVGDFLHDRAEQFTIPGSLVVTLAATPFDIVSVVGPQTQLNSEGSPQTTTLQYAQVVSPSDDDEYALNSATLTFGGGSEGRKVTVNYRVTNPEPHVRVKKHLGGPSQTADADLIAADPQWTSAMQGINVAYLYLRLRYNGDVFPAGLPNITAVVKGRPVADPRDVGSPQSDRYTVNPALVVRDWLLHNRGFSCQVSEIDDDSIVEAANICDERVTMAAYSITCTANAASSFLTLASDIGRFGDGDGVRFTTTGVLPSPLIAGTTYYYIERDRESFRVASTYENAIQGVPITISTAGSGTHTIHHVDQARYTLNGTANLADSPRQVLEKMLDAMAGKAVYSAGTWKIYAGAYRSPSVSLDEDDLRGPISVVPSPSRKDLFNAVRGVYANPAKGYVADDFPPYKNATYETEDGALLYRDISLDFVTNSTRAQRIAKITLEKSRQSITVSFPAKLNANAFKLEVMDTVQLSIDQLGWTNKVFQVMEWKLAKDGLGIDLVLQEEASTVYDWASGEQTNNDPAPNTSLPDPRTVANPSGLTLSSGAPHLLIANDGSVINRIKVQWTPAADEFVQHGGRYQIQWKKSTDIEWAFAEAVPGDESKTYLSPVQDGVMYDVRIRSVNSINVKAQEWVAQYNYIVIGKTKAANMPAGATGNLYPAEITEAESDPPADVTGFSAVQNGDVVVFRWTQVDEQDLAGYEIRFSSTSINDWDAANAVSKITRGTQVTSAAIPPGDWRFYIKAKDSSGNFSEDAAASLLSVTSVLFDVVEASEAAPDWPGTKTNLYRHWTGVLVPASTKSPSQHTRAELFEQYVPYPAASIAYEAPELDAGMDTALRTWATIGFRMGPGHAGAFAPELEMDSRLNAGAYDGFASWSVGAIEARYVKHRFTASIEMGSVPVITEFDCTIDAEIRTETHADVAVDADGVTVTFDTAFLTAPQVTVHNADASVRIWAFDVPTTTGVVIHGYNTSGTEVGGTATVHATGV